MFDKQKIKITVTAEGLAHAHYAQIPLAAHAHNPGFMDSCVPVYAHAHNRKNPISNAWAFNRKLI